MAVAKTTIVLTVLHDADLNLDQWELAQIVEEITDGSFVGAVAVQDKTLVKNSEIGRELEAMGSDRTFFDP